MPEDKTVETPAAGAEDKSARTFTQDQVNAFIAEEKRRFSERFADYDEIKTKAAEFDKVAEAQKSETQKAIERAEAAERERDALKMSQLRLEVGSAKGLTPAQAKRLAGSTKEELEADADDLLAAFKAEAKSQSRTHVPPGKPVEGEPGSRAAAALREMRRG